MSLLRIRTSRTTDAFVHFPEQIFPRFNDSEPELFVPETINDGVHDGIGDSNDEGDLLPRVLLDGVISFDDQATKGQGQARGSRYSAGAGGRRKRVENANLQPRNRINYTLLFSLFLKWKL